MIMWLPDGRWEPSGETPPLAGGYAPFQGLSFFILLPSRHLAPCLASRPSINHYYVSDECHRLRKSRRPYCSGRPGALHFSEMGLEQLPREAHLSPPRSCKVGFNHLCYSYRESRETLGSWEFPKRGWDPPASLDSFSVGVTIGTNLCPPTWVGINSQERVCLRTEIGRSPSSVTPSRTTESLE